MFELEQAQPAGNVQELCEEECSLPAMSELFESDAE